MGETAAHLTHKSLAGIDIAIIAVYFVVILQLAFILRARSALQPITPGQPDVAGSPSGIAVRLEHIHRTLYRAGRFRREFGAGRRLLRMVGCLILLVLGWVFVPFYLRSNVFTMPEFLERRFSRSCAVYLAGISILAYVFTKISVHLYAAAIVLERVVGWSPLTAAVILVIATGIYTIAGGLAAVIYTDLVQTLILIFGAVHPDRDRTARGRWLRRSARGLAASYFHMVKP